jgi:hypothetical protein
MLLRSRATKEDEKSVRRRVLQQYKNASHLDGRQWAIDRWCGLQELLSDRYFYTTVITVLSV